jgi:hypothetical protein
MVQDPSVGPSIDLPLVLGLAVSCFVWARDIHEQSAPSSNS